MKNTERSLWPDLNWSESNRIVITHLHSLLSDQSVTWSLDHSTTRLLDHLVARFRFRLGYNVWVYMYYIYHCITWGWDCVDATRNSRIRTRCRTRTAARLQRHRGEHALNTLIFLALKEFALIDKAAKSKRSKLNSQRLPCHWSSVMCVCMYSICVRCCVWVIVIAATQR